MLQLQPTPLAQWYTLVNEAEYKASVALSETLESYLVYLLMRFTDKPEIARSIIAEDYLEALAKQSQSDAHLQTVGDKCLLMSGLFPQRAKKRGLSDDYFSNMGRTAYFSLHTKENHPSVSDTIFAQLAYSFEELIHIMRTMGTLDAHNKSLACFSNFF